MGRTERQAAIEEVARSLWYACDWRVWSPAESKQSIAVAEHSQGLPTDWEDRYNWTRFVTAVIRQARAMRREMGAPTSGPGAEVEARNGGLRAILDRKGLAI